MTQVRESFAKYKVEEVLGEGAMGVVYACYDSAIGRRVAIKTIHAHLLQGAEGEELRQRFSREIRAVGKLSHPNIVGIFDTDEATDDKGAIEPYFVMEFVDGQDLQAYLASGTRFPLTKTIDIACQVLDAFEYTHKLGIIHRDVKPANIFLTEDGHIKIADFGIARVDNSSLTQTGAVMGTPNYMSPEQCSGQVMDSRSDLFSIAVVLYELLTGEKAFSGNSVHATMMKLVQSNPEPPSVFNPSLPKSLDAVMAKALAKSPDDRFQSAAEFARALEPFKQGSKSAPQGSEVASGEETLLVTQPELSGKDTKLNAKGKRRPPMALLSGVAAALLLTGGIGFYTLSGKDEVAPAQRVNVQPFATDLSPATQEKVEKLLRVANMHESANRLVFPSGSSAYYVYNTVFELDPGNPRARAGLLKMEDKLEKQAQAYYRQKDFKTLDAHLKAGLEAFPDNAQFRALRDELDRLGNEVLENNNN
ncbi:serine/threonine protein kinase [Marinobacter salexigens]|uniref:Serine/threonine protein kinase n=1 Tax=Marinobacter salexigens TaxID=1925763 RepID=A0ABS6A800_9GAMM|nr:serine/threonine-protein kinase [Marinobacter salexigens]MBU2874213.1 serine/threonine protein kinase [Marinobacter salexigens]